MNKAQLIDKINKTVNINKKKIEQIIDTTVNIIIDELNDDKKVTIAGFGTFLSRTRHARKGVNPQNPKERITIPKVKVAKFQTGYRLKQTLKGKR